MTDSVSPDPSLQYADPALKYILDKKAAGVNIVAVVRELDNPDRGAIEDLQNAGILMFDPVFNGLSDGVEPNDLPGPDLDSSVGTFGNTPFDNATPSSACRNRHWRT